MPEPLSVEEILPLIAALRPEERARLFQLVARNDAERYAAIPVRPDEFSTEDDPMEWESDGWENLS